MYTDDFATEELEPPCYHALCGTTHSPQSDCPDDELCVLTGCERRATHGPGSIPAFCIEHDRPGADNE